jgi:hypothetical protein
MGKSGHSERLNSWIGQLFDHLVGAAEQRQRDGEAQRFCGLEIHDQLDLRGLLDRRVGRLLALENAARLGRWYCVARRLRGTAR